MSQGCPPDVAIINCLGREVTAAPFVYVGMLCPGVAIQATRGTSSTVQKGVGGLRRREVRAPPPVVLMKEFLALGSLGPLSTPCWGV